MSADDRQDDAVDLVCHRLDGQTAWTIRRAPLARAWMDAFPNRWPCRCLPMTIANQAGWELVLPASFVVTWDGAPEPEALRIEFDEETELYAPQIRTHFGGGILTIAPPLLFRTRASVGLFVRGPCNHWVDGAAALDGWVESWGLEANFTMNWRITRPDHPVRFERGEPFCLIQPCDVGLLERMRPTLKDLADDPDLEASFRRWSERRFAFDELRPSGRSQHTYTQGRNEAADTVPDHRTSLNLREFTPPE